MRIIFIGIVWCLLLSSCTTKVVVEGIDKGELRRTDQDSIAQLSLNFKLSFSNSPIEIGYSELDISVNHIDLGKSVIGGDTEAINASEYALPLRVTFPIDQLNLSDSNLLEINGFIQINGKSVQLQYTDTDFVIKNYYNM
ncbi:MAG: hypothetical protein LC105_03440 [Chitinophagales bacterium]|nr:hypothetical protein [Chitinophagales bacterium]MCZ2392895.1 hypothetical protein [Chitinophagales bacterium]